MGIYKIAQNREIRRCHTINKSFYATRIGPPKGGSMRGCVFVCVWCPASDRCDVYEQGTTARSCNCKELDLIGLN